MRGRRLLWGAAALGLLAGLPACGGEDTAASTPDARVPVRVEAVARRDLVQTVTLSGRLSANEEVEIRPKLAGRIVRFDALEGDRVAAGDLIVELDTTELRLELQRAEAAVAQARARRDEAVRKRTRAQELFERKIASQASLDSARAEAQVAEADLLTSTATRDLARQRLADARIVAPIDGVLQERRASVGDLVGPLGGGEEGKGGRTGGPIFTLIQTDPLQLEVYVSEKDAPGIRTDDTVFPIHVDAVPGREFEGRIDYVAPSLDPVAYTQMLRLRVANTDGVLKPGMFARIEAVKDAAKDALVVPADALVDVGEGQGVYVVDEHQVARLRAIKTLFVAGNQAAVGEGLSEGENVIVEGKGSVREGTEVRLVGAGAAGPTS